MFFVTSEPSIMVLSILETSLMKTHEKRPFKNHAHHQYNVQVFFHASTVQGLMLFVIGQDGMENSSLN